MTFLKNVETNRIEQVYIEKNIDGWLLKNKAIYIHTIKKILYIYINTVHKNS